MIKKVMLLALLIPVFVSIAYAEENLEIWLFYGRGCPHCAEMKPFLENLAQKYNITLVEYEIYFNKTNLALFYNVSNAYRTKVQGVPTVFIDKAVFVGQSAKIDKEIEEKVKECLAVGCVSPSDVLKEARDNVTILTGSKSGLTKESTEIVSGLTWSTLIGAAAVDSINPCTLAIQLILLTTILAIGKRIKVLLAGISFTLAIYTSYLLMGLGIYSALEVSGISHLFYYFVILIAVVVGILSIRDYFEYTPGGWAVEIPMRWRPLLKKLIKGATSVPGAALIGFFCSLFLLPCSSGPYLVILGLLAKASTRSIAIPLLLVYNFIFILPMIGITLIVYLGLTSVEKAHEWRERNIRKIHLISGIIMLGLAALLVISLLKGWV
ncbi:MAG: conjugal transfer protein TraF [Nanoarchaeota archaeon]|nr:conjugal transfer protein TraF [Nanoarchaeota archaeon]